MIGADPVRLAGSVNFFKPFMSEVTNHFMSVIFLVYILNENSPTRNLRVIEGFSARWENDPIQTLVEWGVSIKKCSVLHSRRAHSKLSA
jgi:hypothetical protein